MSDSEILHAVEVFPAKHLIFTGGEPALHLDEDLVELFVRQGYYVQVETNGTLPLPSNIHWVTCSPKEELLLTRADELKVVYTGQDVSEFDAFECRCRFLQPCSQTNTQEVIAYVKQHPEWHLSIQWHKYLDIP
jgi:organic radical activating enzyme